jgi:hypothetical protein
MMMGIYAPDRTATVFYNGLSWTAGPALTNGRGAGMGVGTTTAGLYVGGNTGPKAHTEEYNGTSWTEKADLNAGRGQAAAGGTTASAVFAAGVGGSPSTNPTQSETYDGTTWSVGSTITTGRGYLTGGGSSSDDTILFGGGPMPGVTTKTEVWDGTAWAEKADMSTASETSFGTAVNAGASTYRARTPANGPETEEWTVPYANAIKTFTSS